MPLTPFCLMLSACLRVIPDKSQFFQYDAIFLSCDDPLNSTTWKVKRSTADGGVRPCSFSWGSTSSGSTCTIKNSYPSDSGVYWCESADGNKSNAVNITVTGTATVILESPALPVSTGAVLTLHCRAKTNSSNQVFDFYKDDQPVGQSATGDMTIHGVSKSHEGFYKCSVSENESAANWLAVEVGVQPGNFTPTPGPPQALTVSTVFLVCTILLITLYTIMTVACISVHRQLAKARADAKRAADRQMAN
uniref:Ig-like domain-containing protein n=1 Tax=Echeneis naucrates TaxID=173247 RepID=A0A665TG14_ECHNA